MDKLQMAHEFAMKLIECRATNKTEDIIRLGWEYADAMQAEADKRKPSGLPEALQEDLPYYEVGRSYPPDAYVMYEGKKTLAVSIGKEWQPDWSQAPDNARYWAMDGCGQCNWYARKPEICGNQWDFGGVIEQANSNGYQGNWQDSLRKRPHDL